MSHEDLRIGLVGCGGIGGMHMNVWSETEGGNITAVCDIVPERAQAAAEKTGGAPFTDFTEMLAKADIDAVDICTWSGLHAQQGIEAMQAGKHVLTEKPIDIDLEKIDGLIELADRTGLKLACIFQYRFSPQIQKANQLIREGKLGRIISCSTYVKWYRAQHDYYDTADWRGTWKYDGGVLGNQGIHSIDQMCWMAGPVEEVEYARIETIERNIEAETFAIAAVRFASGARGVVEGTTNCFPGLATRTEIFGTLGSASFNGKNVEKFAVLDEEIDLESDPEEKTDARSDPMALGLAGHGAQIRDFVLAIKEDRPVLCDGRSARVPVDALTKIYRKAGYSGRIGT